MKKRTLFLSVFLAAQTSFGADVCADYAIGETRAQRESVITGFLTGTNQISYNVTRLNKNKYRLELNPVFMTLQEAAEPGAPQKLVQSPSRRADVQRCFQWFNKKYGENLKPKILLALSSRPTPVYINLNKDPEFRSDSRNYQEDDLKQCPVVIHESLHLMGLWDEYEERGIKLAGQPLFDCRATSDSIMATTTDYQSGSFYHLQELVCACPLSDKNDCVVALRDAPEDQIKKGCPRGSVEILRLTKEKDGPIDNSVSDALNTIRFFRQPYKGTNYLTANFYTDKILIAPIRPAHIRQLLHPKCESKNNLYRQCVKNAYKSSLFNGGSCPPKPPECEDSDVWLK